MYPVPLAPAAGAGLEAAGSSGGDPTIFMVGIALILISAVAFKAAKLFRSHKNL